jgi:hypothetical protein
MELGESGMEAMHEANLATKDKRTEAAGIGYNDSIFLAALPNPRSCRDGYAFSRKKESKCPRTTV